MVPSRHSGRCDDSGGAVDDGTTALSDDGAPAYDHQNAADLAALGSAAFACTPELFPELIAAAIQKQNIARWAAANNLVTVRGESGVG